MTENENDRLPIAFKGVIAFLEGILVIILGIFIGDFLLSLYDRNETIPSRYSDLHKTNAVIRNIDAAASSGLKYEHLLNYDPFFGAQIQTPKGLVSDAPESNLNISIFGLRYREKGKSSVILKIQGKDQTRAVVGENLTPNVRLVGIFQDRIEIARNGIRESVYYKDPSNRQRKITSTSTHPPKNTPDQMAEQKAVMARVIQGLDLSIFRNGHKVGGFIIGKSAEKHLLSLLALEYGDLLVSVNGEKLVSYEKLEELPDEIDGAPVLELDLIRRGITTKTSVTLAQLLGK